MTPSNPSAPASSSLYARSHPSVRISSKRFTQSPFAPRYLTDNTLLGCYCNRFYPLSFGGDVLEHYWKLRRDALLFDVPEKPLAIQGPDAVALLEKVLTRRVANLKTGRAYYALACTPQGGIQMDGVLIRLAEEHFWYVQADGEFESWLWAHAEGLNVAISDPQSRVLQIQGPRALDILRAAVEETVTDSFAYFHAGFFTFAGQRLLVTRTGWTGELGFEVYSTATTDCLALWDHLLQCGQPFGLENAALDVMGVRRIEAGILDNGTDMDRSMTPFDVGLGQFVDFSKAAFVGRAALEMARQERRLFGILCTEENPHPGCQVVDAGQIVGHIRVGAWSPGLRAGIGYVLFDQAAAPGCEWPGRSLSLRNPAGELFACTVVNLPFFDAEKRIPRGLATAAT